MKKEKGFKNVKRVRGFAARRGSVEVWVSLPPFPNKFLPPAQILPEQGQPGSACLSVCHLSCLSAMSLSCMGPKVVHGRGPGGAPLGTKAPLVVGLHRGASRRRRRRRSLLPAVIEEASTTRCRVAPRGKWEHGGNGWLGLWCRRRPALGVERETITARTAPL